MLPIEIQMQIDLTAAAHKREVAEGFAKAKERLLPPIPERPEVTWQRMLMNAGPQYWQNLQAQLAPAWARDTNPFLAQNQNDVRNWYPQAARGAGLSFFGGLFT